jgi:hypothetical protein
VLAESSTQAFAYFDGVEDTNDGHFHAGDTINVVLNVASSTSGTAVISNLATGLALSYQFGVDSSHALCQSDVEWAVSGTSTMPQFSVTLTGASATLTNGGTVGPGDATYISEVVDEKKLALTATSLSSDGSVKISYVQEWADTP